MWENVDQNNAEYERSAMYAEQNKTTFFHYFPQWRNNKNARNLSKVTRNKKYHVSGHLLVSCQ